MFFKLQVSVPEKYAVAVGQLVFRNSGMGWHWAELGCYNTGTAFFIPYFIENFII